MYYDGKVKPQGRYYFVLGLLFLALLHEGTEVFAGLSGAIEMTISDQFVYIIYVLLKSIGPILIFYASLVMYSEAKRLKS